VGIIIRQGSTRLTWNFLRSAEPYSALHAFRPMTPPSDNRAVSALFRIFGGAGERIVADAHERTSWRGMHHLETAFFAVIVPLTVLVAVGDWLVAKMGIGLGLVLAGPLAFLALNILPFLLCGKSQRLQWWLWLGSGAVWGVIHSGDKGIVGFFGSAWIVILALNFAASFLLVFKKSLGLGNVWRMMVIIALHLLAVWIGIRFGWGWGLAAGAGIAIAFCWAVLRPCSQLLGPVVCWTGSRKILITIDDGPDPHDTPVLLDLLDRHGKKAIFFMIGEKVRAYPDLAREVLRRGHEIGNHTLTHPQASFWIAGPSRTRREISECQRVIEEVTGERPRWFRAPVGHRNFFTHPIAKSLGLQVMAWNRRGYDAVEKDPQKVIDRILPHLGPGDIVLVHEATPIAAEVLNGVLLRV
jgi:peptidoglycan/xylan/chitin deacetylase (PgdA/CDA1 family)